MNIRDQITQDFDKVLNLSDGSFAGTREDPVIILDESDVDAIITAVEYLRCINVVLKRDWSIIKISPLDYENEALVKIELEAIVMEDDAVYLDSLAYFFKCPKFQVDNLEITQSPCIGFDAGTLFPFPISLGWSRFTGSIENEPKSMGTTIQYSARSLTLSLNIYHRNVANIGGCVNDVVRSEFMENVSEVRLVHPDYELYGKMAELPDMLIQEFISKEDYSLLALTALNDHFLKVRITAEPDQTIVNAARSTVQDIRAMAEETRVKLAELGD